MQIWQGAPPQRASGRFPSTMGPPYGVLRDEPSKGVVPVIVEPMARAILLKTGWGVHAAPMAALTQGAVPASLCRIEWLLCCEVVCRVRCVG